MSTSDIPDAGECCDLTTVTLPGAGVTLTAGTTYWLVAGPDNINGADFRGRWEFSYEGDYAYLDPLPNWFHSSSLWPAGEILGSRLAGASVAGSAELVASKAEARGGKAIIFSNLDRPPDPPYIAGLGVSIAGNEAFDHEEAWQALPFTPKSDVHAKTLAAAISYVSGTRLVNLGIYSDVNNVPGTLLPGGQGSTSEIPDNGECCELTTVTLPGAGVGLTGGTKYWLVASPDNINAPSFNGLWQRTGVAEGAYQEPELLLFWTDFSGGWQAAEIRGSAP